MMERRAKILNSMLKKREIAMSKEEIEAEIQDQNADRDKIIGKISYQKIEKMVKQSNTENKIEIVTLLLDGSFQLPAYMHAQDGKSNVNGTLTGLKYFEKVMKTEESSHLVIEN